MEWKIDRIISGLCIVLASLLLIYCGAISFDENDGTTSDKVFDLIDNSSSFSEEDRRRIVYVFRKGADKETQNKIYEYVREDDLDGLEEYLGTILIGEDSSY